MNTASQVLNQTSFLAIHFDAIIASSITIVGLIISYFLNKKNFKNEILKSKLAMNDVIIKDLPYEVCQLMDYLMKKPKEEVAANKLSELLSKILAYGSKKAVSLAVRLQKLSYNNVNTKDIEKSWEMLSCYALLITQLKYDLTSEIISPESWFELRIKDYENVKSEIILKINTIIDDLCLNKSFKIKEVK